nr:hypothetical protein [Oceanirhabdus seepicola]
MYANGRGYNLEIYYDKYFNELWNQKAYVSSVNKNNEKIYLDRKNDTKQFCGVSDYVLYDKQSQKNRINELLMGLDYSIEFMDKYPGEIEYHIISEMKSRILSEIINCMMLYKDEYFSYEKEYRIAYNISNCNELGIVRHRVRNDIIIPYIELGFDNNVIESIAISPRLKNDVMAIKGLNSFVDSVNKINKLNQIKVVFSECSIR